MPKIVFTEPSGARREIHAPVGVTLMEVARQHGVAGIVALRGGACACATPQVHVGTNLDGLEVAVPKRQRE
jgi:2Fe-2S ferredoxin